MQMCRFPSSKRTRIQYLSDLHLENCNYEFHFPQEAPNLVLAGDIGRLCDFTRYRDFVFEQCIRFDHVYLVLGNHEFYGCSHGEGLDLAMQLVKDSQFMEKLTILHREKTVLHGTDTILLGCTLHSYISPECSRLSRDFARIKDWTVQQHNMEHERDLSWLRESLRDIANVEPQKDVIIVTHFAPAFELTCHPRHTNKIQNECWCSNALKTIRSEASKQIRYWIFGHTHWNTRFRTFGITVLSNQKCHDSRGLSWLQSLTRYRAFDSCATLAV